MFTFDRYTNGGVIITSISIDFLLVCFVGFYQLAGGTNSYTVESLKKEGLFRTRAGTGRNALIGGIAYGGYARKVSLLTMLCFTILPELTQSSYYNYFSICMDQDQRT